MAIVKPTPNLDKATETIGDETVLLGKKIKDAPRPSIIGAHISMQM